MADKIQIDADTSGAISKLDALNQKVNQLSTNFTAAFSQMNSAATVLTGTLAALGASVLTFADDVTDLAAANQIAVGEILSLSDAMAQSGGKAENAGKFLQTLSNNIAQAAEGNLKSLGSFEKLGVSLTDLGNLSNSELKDKLLDSIAAIEDPMLRNAKAVEMFGKSMVGVDVRKFAEDQKKNREENEKFSESLNSFGDAADNISKIFKDVKLAFAEAFEPLAKQIKDIKVDVPLLADAFRVLAVVVGGFVALKAAQYLIAIRNALIAVTLAARANPFVAVISGIVMLVGYIASIEQLGDKTKNALSKITEAVLGFAGDILSIGTSGFNNVWENIIPSWLRGESKLPNLGEPLLKLKKQLEDLRKAREDAMAKANAPAPKPAPAPGGAAGDGRDVSGALDAIQKQKDKLAQVGQELQKNFDLALKKYQVESDTIGISEQQKSIAEAISKIEIDAAAAKKKLQDDFSALNKEDQARQQAFYQEQLTSIDEISAKQKIAEESSIKQTNARKAAFEDLKNSLNVLGNGYLEVAKLEAKTTIDSIGGTNQRIAAEQQFNEILQRRAAVQAVMSKLGGNEQLQVAKALDIATLSTSRLIGTTNDLGSAFAETFSNQLRKAGASSDVIKEVISGLAGQNYALAESTRAITEAQQQAAENSRSFSAGWSRAFSEYVSNATNAANIASGIFNKFATGIEDYFIDRLKGIDGGWKKFLAGLAEEIARSQIRQLLAKVLTFGGASAGATGAMGAAGSTRGNSPNNPVWTNDISNKMQGLANQSGKVSEEGGFFEELQATITDFASNVSNFLSNMFSGLGNLISNLTSGIGSIVSSIGGTLFDVIGSIGGTLFDVIGSLGSGLGDILGSLGGGSGSGGLFSTLFDIGASLFGFANGGVIPSNKPVIVGERGPELLFGAGGMGVRSNEDSFGGSTVVTYNINAVDALSFKQMIAQDPTFLYAVTQQGAKGMPNRR
jgi:hypothetical protein